MFDIANILSEAANNPIVVGAATNIDNALIVPTVVGDLPRHKMLAAFTGAAASLCARGLALWILASLPVAGWGACIGPAFIIGGAAYLLYKAFSQGGEEKSHNSFLKAALRVLWIDSALGIDSVIASYSAAQNNIPGLVESAMAGFGMLMAGTVVTIGLQSLARKAGVDKHRFTRGMAAFTSSVVNTGAYGYLGYLGGAMLMKGTAMLLTKFGAAAATVTGKGVLVATLSTLAPYATALASYALAAMPLVGIVMFSLVLARAGLQMRQNKLERGGYLSFPVRDTDAPATSRANAPRLVA